MLTDHVTHTKSQQFIRPLLKNSMLIEIPKPIHNKKETLPYSVVEKFDKTKLHMEQGHFCLECESEIADSDHYS